MIVGFVLKRFVECRDRFIKRKVNAFQNLFYFFDWVFSYIIHGASINDYFAYQFYKLRYSGRKEYITYRRYIKIQNICNIKADREVCRSKVKFNKHFSKYLNREWLDFKQASLDDFKDFVTKYDNFFLKSTLSYRGIGVNKINTNSVDITKLYNSILSDKKQHFILEEEILQNAIMAEYHPWSINTIRIVTLYDDKDDKVYLMNARLRMGNNKNSVDNFHFSGIGANIDLETGIINSLGYDMYDKTYLCHPLTGKQIIGSQIPFWEECKDFVKKAVKEIPTVRYVGWDIVLDTNDNFLLIEANDNADHDFQQLHNRGLWKDYKSIINQL